MTDVELSFLSGRRVVKHRGLFWFLDPSQGIDHEILNDRPWDADVVQVAEDALHSGDVALDVGAHIGTITLPMARRVGAAGRVYAYEPTVAGLVLDVHKLLNHLDQVIHEPWAIGKDCVPRKALYGIWSPRVPTPDQVYTDYTFPTLSLDAAWGFRGWQSCALVKVDVDGFEPDVIAGATLLLRELRPILILEVSESTWRRAWPDRPFKRYGEAVRMGLEPLIALGYRIVSTATGRQVSVKGLLSMSGQDLMSGTVNVACFPKRNSKAA